MYLRTIKLGDAVYVELPHSIAEEYNIRHDDRILIPDDSPRNPFWEFRVVPKEKYLAEHGCNNNENGSKADPSAATAPKPSASDADEV